MYISEPREKRAGQKAIAIGRSFALYAFAIIAVALFLGRGVYRASHPALHDFSSPYAGCVLFWTGCNPYDEGEIVRILNERGAPSTEHTPPVYFPTAFVALAPLGLLPPVAAKVALLVGGVVLLMSSVWLWAKHLGISFCSQCCLLLFVAACNPLHTALSVVNLALPVSGLCIVGILFVVKKRPVLGGVFVILACMIKPQIGAAAAVALASRANWQLALSIATYAFCLLVMAVLWLIIRQPEAVSCWMAALKSEFNYGSISAMGTLAVQRIDLGGLWSGVTRHLLPGLWQAVIACLFAISVAIILRRRLTRESAVSSDYCWLLTGAAIFLLILGYHRGYDALLLCSLWILIAYLSPPLRHAWVLYIVQLVWILPGAGFGLWLNQKGAVTFAASGISQYLWQSVFLRLHAWALLITALCYMMLSYRYASHD